MSKDKEELLEEKDTSDINSEENNSDKKKKEKNEFFKNMKSSLLKTYNKSHERFEKKDDKDLRKGYYLFTSFKHSLLLFIFFLLPIMFITITTVWTGHSPADGGDLIWDRKVIAFFWTSFTFIVIWLLGMIFFSRYKDDKKNIIEEKQILVKENKVKKIKGLNENGEKIIVSIKGNKIKSIKPATNIKNEEEFNQYIIPGFIDIHTQGSYNFDWNNGDEEKLNFYLNKISIEEGITSVVASTKTLDVDNLEKFSYYVNKKFNGASLIGWNLENIKEFVNGNSLDEDKINEIIDNDKIKISMLTENPLKLSSPLNNNLQGKEIKIVASFNALNEKEIGSLGINSIMPITEFGTNEISLNKNAIINQEIFVEIINDKNIINENNIKTIKSLKNIDKILLITNSFYMKGLKEGIYTNSNEEISMKDNVIFKNEKIVGSSISMHQAFKKWINEFNGTLAEAIKVTSTNQANFLGLKTKGKIEVGYDADINIISSDNYEILETIKDGYTVSKMKKTNTILGLNNIKNFKEFEQYEGTREIELVS